MRNKSRFDAEQYIIGNPVYFTRYKRSSATLRIVAKARHQWGYIFTDNPVTDKLVYKNYID